MIYGVYSMRDVKTGFMTPTLDANDESATRNFCHSIVNAPDTILFTYATDFSLYRIADFDSDTGRMIPFDLPELVFEGSNALRNMQREVTRDARSSD